MPRAAVVEKTEPVETSEELMARIKELEAALKEKEAVPEVKQEGQVIPKAYIDSVNKILNQEFTPQIEYSETAPTFTFTVLVPKKYSNASEAHWAMYKEDKRVRVINNSAGPQGVEEWLKMVYENLNPEIRAQIVAERK